MKTRDVAKKAVREQIAFAALRRFKANGFDATTVEDIAGDMGMSTRTFFRYFRSKDDVLLGPVVSFKAVYLAAFERSVPMADLWEALRAATEEALTVCSLEEARTTASDRQAVIRATPALLARQLEVIERLQGEVGELYLAKCAGPALRPQIARAIVRSAFACWHAVMQDGDAPIETEAAILALRDVMTDLRPHALSA